MASLLANTWFRSNYSRAICRPQKGKAEETIIEGDRRGL